MGVRRPFCSQVKVPVRWSSFPTPVLTLTLSKVIISLAVFHSSLGMDFNIVSWENVWLTQSLWSLIDFDWKSGDAGTWCNLLDRSVGSLDEILLQRWSFSSADDQGFVNFPVACVVFVPICSLFAVRCSPTEPRDGLEGEVCIIWRAPQQNAVLRKVVVDDPMAIAVEVNVAAGSSLLLLPDRLVVFQLASDLVISSHWPCDIFPTAGDNQGAVEIGNWK